MILFCLSCDKILQAADLKSDCSLPHSIINI